MHKKRIKIIALLGFASFLISTSIYADQSGLNCIAKADGFSVSVAKDPAGNLACHWGTWIQVGVAAPIGNYTPLPVNVGNSNGGTWIEIDNPTIARCTPPVEQSYISGKLSFSAPPPWRGIMLSCTFAPAGAPDKPQLLLDPQLLPGMELQEYQNGQWVPVSGPDCPNPNSEYCRVGYSSKTLLKFSK